MINHRGHRGHRERLRELAQPPLAMSLSTAKKVLGPLKSKNAIHSDAPLSLVRSDKPWHSSAFYHPGSNEIVVPKQPKARRHRLQQAQRDSADLTWKSSPDTSVASSLHEHGHAADHLGKKAINVANKPTLYRKIDDFAQRQRIMLKLEKRANVNVLRQIQKSGTPEEVAGWKKWANRQMHSYRNSFMQGLHERVDDNRSLKLGEGSSLPLKKMPLSYKRELLQKYPHLQKSATQLQAAREHRERLRELARVSGRLVELARVQSVSGKVLNISPVPRKVADPILKSLRRKLEKGGDREAVRAAFLGPRMRRASGELWKPRLVDIDGKKSILHYRITKQESHLKPSNADLPAPPNMTPEDIMRNHIGFSSGRAISTSTRRASAMRLVSEYGGKTPVEGVYATPLDELIKNQREKIKGAMINARYPAEREITQMHGDNLLKVRKHKAIVDPTQRPGDDVTYTRSR